MIKESSYSILAHSIEFERYNLFFSTLHQNRIVNLDRINAVDLSTSPHSLIIDNREIIFLNHGDTELLPAFAARNKIPQTTHIDTWAILTRDYLDTELNSKVMLEQNQQLTDIGIDQHEFKKISKALKSTLFGTMEWTYLGLWDVLAMKQYRNPFYRFFGRNFYWQAMAIALKGSGYEKQQLK